jgi:hypothetical protein
LQGFIFPLCQNPRQVERGSFVLVTCRHPIPVNNPSALPFGIVVNAVNVSCRLGFSCVSDLQLGETAGKMVGRTVKEEGDRTS